MSFIYQDPKLLQDLVKSAIDFEVKFNKHGQLATDPTVNVEYRNYLNLTKKLADQLEQQYFPTPKDTSAPSEVHSQTEAPLTATDLTTLGSFLDYTFTNSITVDGQRVVYSAAEVVNTKLDPKKWLPINTDQAKLASPDELQTHKIYYVNKDLLTKYINSLLDKTSQEDPATQRFIKSMLGGVIRKINAIFQTQLTTEYKPPAPKAAEQSPGQTAPGQATTSQQSQMPAGMTPAVLAELVSLRPFNSEYIAFREIANFVDKYAPLANRPEISTDKDQIQTSINMANLDLIAPNTPIDLDNLTTDRFKLLLKQPNRSLLLAHYLYTIISVAATVYRDFVVSFERYIADPRNNLGGENSVRALKQQIAPGGPVSANLSSIMKMLTLLPEDLKKGM